MQKPLPQHRHKGVLPVGRYEISGHYLPTGEQVLVGINCEGNYGTSVTVDFEEELNYCTTCVALEVTLASEQQGQTFPNQQTSEEMTITGTMVALCYQVGDGCDNERSHFIEITESAVLGDVNATIATLEELKKLGIRLAIDDQGYYFAKPSSSQAIAEMLNQSVTR